MIRQKELHQLRRTLDALAELETSARLVKADLIARLDAGEEVQPGRFAVRIDEQRRQTFSEAAVAAVLGPKAAADLKGSLPVSVARSLKLQEA